MSFDEDPDEEEPLSDRLLPPDDRLWRHPSEVAAGLGPVPAPPGARHDRRGPALTALAGACLAGAIVAFGAMWITRPTRLVDRSPGAEPLERAIPTQNAVFGGVPTQRLAHQLGGTVVQVRVERAGRWTSGSAVCIDGRGTLAVSAPLVAGASQVLVIGRDRSRRSARLVGIDPATGVAALVTDQTSGTPVQVADHPVRTGDSAAVVGAHGGDAGAENRDATIAMVVVRSVSGRATVGDVVLHGAIQLDRAAPSDAHGGALVNADGDLVGMVIGNSTEHDLGAVIPADVAVASATDLRDEGKVRRAWLGVRAVDLDPDLAALLDVSGGARLTEVTPGSPAAGAGLRRGDVITAIDGRSIDDASDLVNDLATHQPGDHAAVHLHRQAEVLDLTVVLGG